MQDITFPQLANWFGWALWAMVGYLVLCMSLGVALNIACRLSKNARNNAVFTAFAMLLRHTPFFPWRSYSFPDSVKETKVEPLAPKPGLAIPHGFKVSEVDGRPVVMFPPGKTMEGGLLIDNVKIANRIISAIGNGRGVAIPDLVSGEWSCTACGQFNSKMRVKCFKCQVGRAVRAAPGADWQCSECGWTNYELRSKCRNCGTSWHDMRPRAGEVVKLKDGTVGIATNDVSWIDLPGGQHTLSDSVRVHELRLGEWIPDSHIPRHGELMPGTITGILPSGATVRYDPPTFNCANPKCKEPIVPGAKFCARCGRYHNTADVKVEWAVR